MPQIYAYTTPEIARHDGWTKIGYTEQNVEKRLEPGNAVLRERAAQARAQRDAGQPTLPATLASERACNPFLRSNEAAIRASIETHTGRSLDDDIDAFAELRRWKDGFRA